MYGFTDLFAGPFLSIKPSPQAEGMVLEVSTLISMAVYALAAWALVKIIMVVFDRPSARRVTTIERD